MNEGKTTAGGLVEAVEDVAEMLELAEPAFDPGTLLSEIPVGRARVGRGPDAAG